MYVIFILVLACAHARPWKDGFPVDHSQHGGHHGDHHHPQHHHHHRHVVKRHKEHVPELSQGPLDKKPKWMPVCEAGDPDSKKCHCCGTFQLTAKKDGHICQAAWPNPCDSSKPEEKAKGLVVCGKHQSLGLGEGWHSTFLQFLKIFINRITRFM